MAPPKLPAIDPATLPEQRSTGYPEPYRSRVSGRAKRKLGDACGLTRFGVNLVTLSPGGESALRHWHTLEDEFVYVLSGEVVLVTDAGAQTLTAGMCAGYPAGKRDAHHFVNRSNAPATYPRGRQPDRRRQRVLPGRRSHVGRGRERRIRGAQGWKAVLRG